MMKQLISIALLLAVGAFAGISLDKYITPVHDESVLQHAEKHLDPNYICPMHSEIVSNEPGSCPICGMDLVEIKQSDSSDSDDEYPVVRVSSTMINNMGVRVAQVERKTLVRQIETPGFIQQMMKEKYSRVSAPAKGKVAKLYFEQGQWFEGGEPLIDIKLDDLMLVQEKHLELLAKQGETVASEQVTIADKPVQAAGEVLADKTVDIKAADVTAADTTDADIKATETGTVEVAQEVAASEEAGPNLEKTRLLMRAAGMTDEQISVLEETKVTSPLITLYAKHAGEVKELRVATGDVVKANAMLFTLGGLMRVTVLANAFQRDASWVRPGQDVDIILPHDSNHPWKGKVSSGAVSINPNSQNIGVKLVFIAPSSIVKNGMYVVGNIYGQVREDTLTLPREAIIYSRNEKRVIVALGEGRFKPVVVETGISNDNEVEILKGLEDGDTVVVSAQFLIDSESSLQSSYRRMTGVE